MQHDDRERSEWQLLLLLLLSVAFSAYDFIITLSTNGFIEPAHIMIPNMGSPTGDSCNAYRTMAV